MFISYFHVYRPLNIGRSFSHFVRLSCAHASPLAIWLTTAQRLFLISPTPTLSFSRSALQVIDSRPRVALPSAASSTNSGREQHERRPRVDNVSLSHEGHRPSGGRNLLKTQRLPAANARREGRPECPIPPVAKRCYPRPFPPSPPRSLSLGCSKSRKISARFLPNNKWRSMRT